MSDHAALREADKILKRTAEIYPATTLADECRNWSAVHRPVYWEPKKPVGFEAHEEAMQQIRAVEDILEETYGGTIKQVSRLRKLFGMEDWFS